jgi:hypothetical protein
VRRRGQTLLVRGRARAPDFAFRFTPAAVARLAAVNGDIGDFAVELFSRILEPRGARRIGFRVIAPFAQLARRGYVRLLLAAGPKLVAFGAARGVRTLAELRRRVGEMREAAPARAVLPSPRSMAISRGRRSDSEVKSRRAGDRAGIVQPVMRGGRRDARTP